MRSLLQDIDALFICNPTNLRYVTGFISLAPIEREGFALLTKQRTYLLTHALYLESAKKLVQRKKINVIEISRENPLSMALKKLIKQNRVNRLGFEEADLKFGEFDALHKKLTGIQLVPTRNRVEEIRQTKTPQEIKLIKEAAKITDQCFVFIIGQIKIGMTETELAWQIEKFIREKGAELAFPPIVAFNANSSQPHYSPTNDHRLKVNNLILLDFGARVDGYCADLTRVVFLGKPNTQQRKVYAALLSAQLKALSCLKNPTNPSGAKADKCARDVLDKAKLPTYPHSLGHGLGLDIHENPRLSVKKDVKLKAGMIFTVEPGVYLPGKFGIRIEDTIALTKNGLEILTKSSKKMQIL